LNVNLLESILDADGLSAILRVLADVCGDKSRCTRAIHDDEVTAQSWERIAIYLDEVADTKTAWDCPLPYLDRDPHPPQPNQERSLSLTLQQLESISQALQLIRHVAAEVNAMLNDKSSTAVRHILVSIRNAASFLMSIDGVAEHTAAKSARYNGSVGAP